MQYRDQKDDPEDGKGPLDDEIGVRVLDILDRRPIGHEIQCISEPSLYLVRARITDPGNIAVGGLDLVVDIGF